MPNPEAIEKLLARDAVTFDVWAHYSRGSSLLAEAVSLHAGQKHVRDHLLTEDGPRVVEYGFRRHVT